jgi:hypothetical protein
MFEKHLQLLPWKFSAFSEKLLCSSFLWVGSGTATTCNVIAACNDFYRGEETIEVDWSLPLTEHGHNILFTRILADYHRDTAIVPTEKKLRYRKNEEDLKQLRDMVALFSQLNSFLREKLGDAEVTALEHYVMQDTFSDAELQAILKQKLKFFAVSMLESQKDKAKAEAGRREATREQLLDTSDRGAEG